MACCGAQILTFKRNMYFVGTIRNVHLQPVPGHNALLRKEKDNSMVRKLCCVYLKLQMISQSHVCGEEFLLEACCTHLLVFTKCAYFV